MKYRQAIHTRDIQMTNYKKGGVIMPKLNKCKLKQ